MRPRTPGLDRRRSDPGADKHLKEIVAAGDEDHQGARNDMKGRWRNPIKGMGWYKDVKRQFAALPED